MLRRLLDRIYRKDEAPAGDGAEDRLPTAERSPADAPSPGSLDPKASEKKRQEAPTGEVRPDGSADVEGLADTDTIAARVIENIKKIYDPEIPVNIYELGLIYEVRPDETGMVYVKMTLTAPNCPAAGILPGQVESQARAAEGVKDVQLDLVFDPPWAPERMSEAARLELGML